MIIAIETFQLTDKPELDLNLIFFLNNFYLWQDYHEKK